MAFAFMIVYDKKRRLLIKFISSGRKLSRFTPKRTGFLYLLFFVLLYLKTEGLFAVKIFRASRLEGFLLDHETIIRAGITCKKILCYMHDSACRWFIVQKAKIFWSYVKHFWILTGVRKRRILIGLCKQAFFNCPTIFLD